MTLNSSLGLSTSSNPNICSHFLGQEIKHMKQDEIVESRDIHKTQLDEEEDDLLIELS